MSTLPKPNPWWMPVMLIAAALIYSYRATIDGLVHQWLNNDDYSHGMLIVPICIYLAWQRHDQLAQTPRYTDWRGLPLLVFSVVTFVLGELGAEVFTTRISLILCFIASLWLLYGFEVIRVLTFPLAFLFMMLPLPGLIYRNITFPLQLISSKWSVKFLQLCGMMAYAEGNIIDLGYAQFQVVEACSGLRFILALFTLGIFFAFWTPKPLWKRVILVAATVPIAMIANIMRIAGTGLLAKFWGETAAQGFFHSFSGWGIFMISFIFFFGLNVFLGLFSKDNEYVEKKKAAKNIENKNIEKKNIEKTNSKNAAIAITALGLTLLLILTAPSVADFFGKVPPQSLKKPLKSFPLKIQGRTGTVKIMDPLLWKRVGGQQYFMADYRTTGKPLISFYVAYYEYQRKGGDFIHSPKLCLPGSGWYIETSDKRVISNEQAGLEFKEMIAQRLGRKQLVYYWYQGRSRNFTNEFAAKFWMVWDGIWRRRTDGALVRVITSITDGQPLNQSRKVLDRFALDVSEQLNQFLP
ncbi:MAG: VPLPA-CTERM-specific exosortase XrtD [Desulfobacteraceae bacterium]|nr:VPLPA-CTERM-specific exosortase XrtD [Desulfobacteraceae bacterium]